MPDAQFALIALAGFAAGAVNALAGGGTLISFPALVAAGFPPLAANITSTIALCPGFLGATYAQRDDLRGQRARLSQLLPFSLLGGLLGAVLLLQVHPGRAVAAACRLCIARLAGEDTQRARGAIGRRRGRNRGCAGTHLVTPGRRDQRDLWRVFRPRDERDLAGGARSGIC